MTLIQKELKWNFENEKNELCFVLTLFSLCSHTRSYSIVVVVVVLMYCWRVDGYNTYATMLQCLHCISTALDGSGTLRNIWHTVRNIDCTSYMNRSIAINTTLTVLHIFRKIKSTIKLCQLSIVLIVVITHSKCDELFVDGRRNSVGCRYF